MVCMLTKLGYIDGKWQTMTDAILFDAIDHYMAHLSIGLLSLYGYIDLYKWLY